MDGLILSRSTTEPGGGRSSTTEEEPLLTVSAARPTLRTPAAVTPSQSATPTSLDTPAAILECLRGSPSQETVVQCLQLLDSTFNIRTPSPLNSQITKVLLETTVPDFWHVLDREQRGLLARCLASPTGLGGIAARTKALIPPVRDKPGGEGAGLRENLAELLVLLQMVLARKRFLHGVWTLADAENEVKRNLLWKEFTALVGSGRLLSVAAEAEMVLGRPTPDQQQRWIGDGKLYALWLGQEIAEVLLRIDIMEDASWKSLSQLLSAGFRLGYNGWCLVFMQG
jgi:telomere length regulation protein